MKSIKIWNDNPSEKQVEQIAERLKDGEIWILPTDSIYGIMCDALNQKAVRKICQLKNINPEKNNLSVICSDISMASEYARFGNHTFTLLKENTPGPYTFLCKTQSVLPKEFKARKIVGVRIPDCNAVREISKALGNPIMTTTIEFDSEDYAINPELVMEAYEGKVDGIVMAEDGKTEPTAIIDCTDDSPTIIREGVSDPIL